MANMMFNNSGYYDPTAFEAMSNIRREEKRKEKMKVASLIKVYRGDIFYVKSNGSVVCGSEQHQDRPAVIVSNNIGNEHSNIVEVVYLTSKKKKLPTHVEIMCRVPSTALCEQVSNISQERLGEFIRSCSDEEMAAIDRALMISLGLDSTPDPTATVDNGLIDDLNMKLEGAERKLDEEKTQYAKLLCEYTHCKEKMDELNAENAGLLLDNGDLKEKLKNAENQIPVFPAEVEKELLKAETQRDMYKELYEHMLEKMIG